jgi:hypothetical protein
MLKNVPIACLLTVVAIVPLAHAQLSKGPNGGIVATSQGHPIELVLKGQEIVFYLRDDDGSALASKDMLGRATIQEGGKTIMVTLEPMAPNMLAGKLEGPVGAKARVVFSANFRRGAHTHTLTARYVAQ